MKKNKKIGILILLAGMILGISGCGNKTVESTSDSVTYTRAQWIQDLGEKFGYQSYVDETGSFSDITEDSEYYASVQACTEWGILTAGDNFYPEEETTWEFALNTVVKAIGTDTLIQAGYAVDENALEDFFLNNIAQVQLQDLGEAITEEEAMQVLAYASTFENDLEMPQVQNIVLQEAVKEVTDEEVVLRGDGRTAYVTGDVEFAAGDILFVYSEDALDYAIRVESVEENLITYAEATLEEVYDTLEISGTYTPKVTEVITGAAERTVFYVDNTMYGGNDPFMKKPLWEQKEYEVIPTAINVETNSSGDSISFRVYDDSGTWSAEAGIKNLKTDIDVKFHWYGGIKEASAKVTYDDYVHMQMNGSIAQSISLGKVSYEIIPGVNLQLSFCLNVGISGEATLDYTADVVAGVWCEDGKIRSKVENNNAALDFHAEVTASAEPLAKVDLRILGQSVVNAKVTTGIVIIAKVDVDLLGNQPACVDVKAFVPLRYAINDDGCWAVKLFGNKAKLSNVIWDAANSPFQWHWHYEDLVLVDKCTRGEEQEVESELVSEDGVPVDEYKIFDFEEISFGMIELYSYMMYLEEGETLDIGFKELPEGLSAADMVYEVVDDAGKCSVSAGKVTGLASGATNIKISSADGRYHAYLTVVVAQEYNDTSDFIPLQ